MTTTKKAFVELQMIKQWELVSNESYSKAKEEIGGESVERRSWKLVS